MIDLSFFAYFLGIPISRNISYLVAASESIVSNKLIIQKTKKIFSFSQKRVVQNRAFLSEDLKTKAKFMNMKSQECYEKPSKKIIFSIYIYFIFYLFFG